MEWYCQGKGSHLITNHVFRPLNYTLELMDSTVIEDMEWLLMSGDQSSQFTTSEQKVSWFAEPSYHTHTFLTHYYCVL